MKRIYLHAKAPFGAFRAFQAGAYRSSMPTIPPSAAYGLVLNIAGIETRDTTKRGATTAMRADLPSLRLAVGDVSSAHVATFYQQLHSYPVGSSSKELAERTHGAKYHIAPIRREVLLDLNVAVAVDLDDDLQSRLLAGLAGEHRRYGVPFAGDNNFFFDRLDIVSCLRARWYQRVDAAQGPVGETTRLTVWIDREDNSRTHRQLFAPSQPLEEPPESAWLTLPPK